MQPIFTMQYGEFAVADFINKSFKDVSVFVPASAQEKGIDLLLYRFVNGVNTINTIQVKTSRAYYGGGYKYSLWFNRFTPQTNADWFVLTGIYGQPLTDSGRVSAKPWKTLMLAFRNREMVDFMSSIRLKSDATQPDRMFGISFNDESLILQTRGCAEPRDLTPFLFKNRLDEFSWSFR